MNKNNNKAEITDWPQNLQNTYLGNKGYTILKNELSIKHQLALKEILMVKPYVPGSPVSCANGKFALATGGDPVVGHVLRVQGAVTSNSSGSAQTAHLVIVVK